MDKQIIVISSVVSKKRAIEAVNACMGDNIQQITIEPYQHDKTKEQRGGWHLLIGILADELGYTFPQMKNVLKVYIMGTEVTEDLQGNEIEQIPSSEDCKRFGYSKLIEGTYVAAAEQGVVLPDLKRTNT